MSAAVLGLGVAASVYGGAMSPTPQPLTVHPTTFGRPASDLLRALVANRQAGDPLRTVTVLVPTNSVGIGARRDLATTSAAGRTGVAGLQVLTLYRLAELLGAGVLAGQGARPVTLPVLATTLRRVLADDPGVFRDVAGHPATEEALVAAHRELSELPAAALDALARASERARDVVRIHRQIRARLATGWYDEPDLLRAAAAQLPGRGQALGPVIVYLPEVISAPERDLLTALAQVTAVDVVVGLTGRDDADAAVRALATDLGHSIDVSVPTVAATRVVSVSDADEEARSAVEQVVEAARTGIPFGRMAVLHPTRDPYGSLVHEHLAAAGIPVAGAAYRPLAGTAVGRFLLDLLALPDRDFARPAVLGLLSCAPVHVDGRRPPVARWERLTRDAGVTRGIEGWRERLRELVATSKRRAEDLGDSEGWLADRLRREAEDANRLLATFDDLADRLDEATRATRWSQLVAWCRRSLADLLDGPDERWPQRERQAADAIDRSLARLGWLDDLEPATDLATFRRTLELELDADLGRTGRIGDGVLLGPPSLGIGLELDLVVLLGMSEGSAPAPIREDPLLPDDERATAGLLLAAERPARLHRQLLAALAAATGTRVLLYPRGDLRRSTERFPSRWLLDTVEALGAIDRQLPPEAPWLDVVPSFAARVMSSRPPATDQQFLLRALAVSGSDDGRLLSLSAMHDPRMRRGVELLVGRRSASVTRFDGDLRGVAELLPSITSPDQVTSATRLQEFVACPHAYFVRRFLRVDAVENPEERLRIDALTKGSLMHEIFEQFVHEHLPDPPEPGADWPTEAHLRLREITDERCDAYEARGLVGHPVLWERDRELILTEVATFLAKDAERRAEHGVRPSAVEQQFSGDHVVTVEIEPGRQVRFRGAVDRVDTGDHQVLVTDYKTGKSSYYAGLSAEDPTLGGTYLQLPLYAMAVDPGDGRPVHAAFWFITDKGKFVEHGYVVDEEVRERFREVIRRIADAHDAGVFPMVPPELTSRRGWTPCRFCDPDELGWTDRHRDWTRKSADLAALGPLAALLGAEAAGA